MHIIKIKFHRLREVNLADLVGAVGVYVIWDSRAKARPTYIGEGTILKRFAEHSTRFARPFDGYIGILGDTSGKSPKREAEIVEAVLLEIAEEMDRIPSANKASGKFTWLVRIVRSHSQLRINVSGYDPFGIPGRTRRLSTAKSIQLKFMEGEVYMRHVWRKRRKLR